MTAEERLATAYHKTCLLVDLDLPHDFDDHIHSARALFAADPTIAADLATGAAFRRAEAALPEGGRLMVGQTEGDGRWWATARINPPRREGFLRIISSEDGRPRHEKHDATPTAALEALAAQMEERK